MRITSSMMTNNMMLNVGRTVRNLDGLWRQQSSGRVVNLPSDNPLVAARALKFRSNMRSNFDFQDNVDRGLAWMDVTQASLFNVVDTLLASARDSINAASNDYLDLDDRRAFTLTMRNMLHQIGLEMNTQFAGRYIFSGLRTNQPPVFSQNQPGLHFEIEQTFFLRDIERTMSLQFRNDITQPAVIPDGIELPPIVHDIHVIKLPYRNIDPATIAGLPAGLNLIPMTLDHYDAYNPEPGEVHFIAETGELIFNAADATGAAGAANFPPGTGLTISYEVNGFSANELNPAVMFPSRLIAAPPGHTLHHLTVMDPNDLDPNEIFFNGFGPSVDNQNLTYEFSTHTTVPVNTLASNVLTPNLFADLLRLVEFVDSLEYTDKSELREHFEAQNALRLPPLQPWSDDEITELIYRHRYTERAQINRVVNDRFNNMLYLIDRHSAQVRQELTDIGSRGRRLELFQNRLEHDEGSLYRLMSQNEDVDVIRLATLISSAQAQYMAAISVGTNIINVTLGNFLQV